VSNVPAFQLLEQTPTMAPAEWPLVSGPAEWPLA